MPPFEAVFDRVASFQRPRGNAPVVLLGSAGVVGFGDLRRVAAVAFGRDARDPHTPHLTLLYDAQRVDEHGIAPIAWIVAEVALVHSQDGAHTVLRRWPLGG